MEHEGLWGLLMGRLLKRSGKRVLREVATKDGRNLRVVAYRIPLPGYRGDGCGGGETSFGAHPDDLIEGMFAAAVESDDVAWILDQIADGLGGIARQDHVVGLGVNWTGGERLGVLLMAAQRDGVLPVLLRSSEVRRREDAAAFVAAWRDASQRGAMRSASARLLTTRDHAADVQLAKEMRLFGIPMQPLKRIAKDGSETEPDGVSLARRQLRMLIATSSRIGRG